MGPSSFILLPCAACSTDVQRIKLDGPRGGGRKDPVAYFYNNMVDRIKLRIQGLDEVQTP